mgnify:CR=1 FL=1
MRILWMADFGVEHNIGGAQRSDAILIEEGRGRGYDITCFHFDSDPSLLNQNYDLVVTANLESLTQSHPSLIEWIASQRCHVRLEHDSNRYLNPPQRTRLFQSARLAIFLTDFHYQQFLSHYGNIFVNVKIIPDPIDTNFFTDLGQSRQARTLYTGFMHELKGTRAFFEHVITHPEESFTVAGWGDVVFEYLAKSLDNVEFLGKIDHADMPALYNNHQKMFYKPVFYEPFCRSVGEALLCGMEITGNNLIGCLHFFNQVGGAKFREDCHNAPSAFWKEINTVVK